VTDVAQTGRARNHEKPEAIEGFSLSGLASEYSTAGGAEAWCAGRR
jgi:hypothetical protein